MAKEIPLSQGIVAIVDDDDYERVSEFKWHYGNRGYAKRNVKTGGKYVTILLHRFIVNCPAELYVDHADGNKLNNRRSNLRICTNQENTFNANSKTISRGKTSKFKGVYWHKVTSKWAAQVGYKHLGLFDTEEEAARAYNEKAKELFGEFAKLNDV